MPILMLYVAMMYLRTVLDIKLLNFGITEIVVCKSTVG